VYKTKKPDPQLGQAFAATLILPKNYIEKVGIEAFKASPVGSGPWKFVKFVSRTSMEMQANKDHWRIVPAYEKVIETMVPEEATRIAMLKRGEVDLIGSLSIDRIVELKNQGFRLQEIGLPTVGNFSFSGTYMTNGPTSDIKIRQAMSYSINRDELSKTFFKGLAVPGSRWFMDENSWGWDPSWKPDSYDLAKAKQLVADAGYPGKFSNPVITVYVTNVGYNADLFQVLQGYWKEAGIQTKIEIVDSVQFGGMIFNRAKNPTDPIVGAIWPWIFPGVPNNVYHSANMYKSTGVHSTGNDPKADELYDKAATELDMKKAEQYWREFQTYAKEMWVNVGLVKLPSYWVAGPNVGEFSENSYISLNDSYAGIKHK
jgi:peptide/nickel transport system substrate-binding protein